MKSSRKIDWSAERKAESLLQRKRETNEFTETQFTNRKTDEYLL
jgi:hypothetical protein